MCYIGQLDQFYISRLSLALLYLPLQVISALILLVSSEEFLSYIILARLLRKLHLARLAINLV